MDAAGSSGADGGGLPAGEAGVETVSRERGGGVGVWERGAGLEPGEAEECTLDRAGCAKVHTNFYSVPVKAGTRVQAKAYPAWVEVWQEGGRVARHERCYTRRQQILDSEHYLGC